MTIIDTRETSCPEPALLERHALGMAHALERSRVSGHLPGCPSCRDAVFALALSRTPGTADEEALVERLLARPAPVGPLPVTVAPATRDAHRPRWHLRALAAAAAVAATAGLVPVAGPAAEEEPGFAGLVSDTRPTEGRLALALPHAPYRPTRGTGGETGVGDDALARLLALKTRDPAAAARPLAALYLGRGESGDLSRAEAEIRSAPAGAERDNDLAVVLLAQGRAEEALRAVDAALARDPGLLSARFNRAVALEAAGRVAEAAGALRGYVEAAAGVEGEEAWVAEARERLEQLASPP